MSEMTDCRDCEHSRYRYNGLLCVAMGVPKPVEWMRRIENDCGPRAAMFDLKDSNPYGGTAV